MKINRNTINSILATELSEEEGGEFIQMIAADEDDQKLADLPDELPILAVRNTVLFPGVLIPITVGRQKSIKVVKHAHKGDKIIGVLTQENPQVDDPSANQLFKVGTVAKIVKMLVLPDGNTTIIVQGKQRFQVDEFTQTSPFLKARVTYVEENFPKRLNKENKALIQSIRDTANRIMTLNPEIPKEAQVALENIEKPSFLVHFLSSNINAEPKEKQGLLEVNDGVERATQLLQHLMKEVQMLELKHEIQSKVHSDIDAQQRDYFLRQQMKVLRLSWVTEVLNKKLKSLEKRSRKRTGLKKLISISTKS